jgi:hypothetical protein
VDKQLPLPVALLVVLVGGLLLGYALPKSDGSTMQVLADGTAEWLYQDTHTEDHGLDPEKFGTPKNPKGLDLTPVVNRNVSADGTRFTSLKDGMIFSTDRTTVTGTLRIDATDLTPLDATNTWDKAEVEANFKGPDGTDFRVVLPRLAPPTLPIQTFGGVGFNHLIHGETGLGTEQLVGVFAYIVVQGFADTYRNGELISSGNYAYFAITQASHAVNKNKQEGRYDPDHPLGVSIAHIVVLPFGEHGESLPIHTGVVGPDGKEQIFFHVNFRDHIQVSGNRFLDRNGKTPVTP